MSRIGEPLERPDGRAKVSGQARFTADFKAVGMLHAAYVPAAIPAGRVKSIDARPALQQPYVVRVLVASDMPPLRVGSCPPAASRFVPLQSDEVRHQGQPVALVLAETLEAALHGARSVEVVYEAAELLVPDLDPTRPSPRATPYDPASGYSLGEQWEFVKGNVAMGLARATQRVSGVYVQPFRHNNPMEPSAILAEWRDDRLVLHDSVQHGYSVQAVLSAAFGIEPSRVRVICPHTGGGFGSKGYVWPHELLTAAAARITGRPVRLVLTRADMYANVGYQPRILQQVTLGADEDGRLTALRQDVVNVTSMSDDFVEQCSMAGKSMYAVPAMHTTQRVERCHVNLPTAMRAPVEGPGTWAMGSAMDELAHALNLDPLDLRLRNYAEADPRDGRPWSSKKLREAYEIGASRFGWHARSAAPRRVGHWQIGYGMADCIMGTYRMASQARVRLRVDGTALVEAGFHDIGSGTLTVMPQIASHVLGLPIEKVGCAMGDTTLPVAGPTYGSSSTLSGGSAVYRAAVGVRDQLARLAELSPERAVMREGYITVAEEYPVRSVAELMRRAGVSELIGEADWAPQPGLPVEGDGGNGPYAIKTFGVVFVEVAVDRELGLLRLRRAVGAYSAGRIINPRTARAQMTGGMIWGWGKAALERSRYEPRLGRWEAKNLSNIALPVNADIPSDALDVVFVDEFDAHASPLGAKGIGELSATGMAAAVANAVFDATGKRVRSLPIAAEALLETDGTIAS